MDVDTRAREASEAVHRAVAVDLEAGLHELDSRRRRRRVEGATALAAVVTLGLLAFQPLLGASDDQAGPASQRPVSTVYYDPERGDGGIGAVRSGQDLGSEHGLDVAVEPDDMAVSPDGSSLAVVTEEDGLTLVDLGTGRSASRYCSRCFEVAWLSSSEVATRGFAADGTVQTLRHDVSGGEPSRELQVPEGTPMSGLSPGGDLAASVRPVPGTDSYRLVITPRAGGVPAALVSTTTPPDGFITDVAWSPDASRIGYVVSSPARDAVGGERYHLHTVLPDGSYPSVVADLGRCACSEDRPPSFAWSPDGGSVVAVVGDSARGRDSFRVVTIDMEELAATAPARRHALQREVASDAGSPVAWG
jgi:hypothetical protein